MEKKQIYEVINEFQKSDELAPKEIMKESLKYVKDYVNLEKNYPTIEEKRKALGGTKIHAFSVQKGGVGKSTLSSDVARTLAEEGYKVLLIDSDPQASLTELCNVSTDEKVFGLQDIYAEMLQNNGRIGWDTIKKAILRPSFRKAVREGTKFVKKDIEFGFDLIPCNIDLSDLDIYLAKESNGALYMSAMLVIVKRNADSDFILIDCMPGLGTLTYDAITASIDGIIVPVNLEPMTIKGAKNLANATRDVQKLFVKLNESAVSRGGTPVLHKGIFGIVKNRYNGRRKVQNKYADILHTFFPIVCFSESTDIPNKTSCDAAHDAGRLYSEYDKAVGEVFKKLVSEIVTLDIYRADEEMIYLTPVITNEPIYNIENEERN